MTAIVFNSVPLEDIDDKWGPDGARDRTQAFIREMMR